MIKIDIRHLACAALCAAVVAFTAARAAEDKEEDTKLDAIPAPAAKALKEHAEGGKIKNVSKETDEGKTVYEGTIDKKGRITEVSVDDEGKVVSVEDTIEISEAPAAVQKALKAESSGGKIHKLERVKENGKTTYEALISKEKKREEVVFSESGKVENREDKTGEKARD